MLAQQAFPAFSCRCAGKTGTGTIRKSSQSPSGFIFEGDGEPEAQCVEERVEAPQFRISLLGKHAVQTFPIQVGFSCQLSDPALGFGDIPYGEKKRLRIAVLQRSIEIFRRLTRITERLDQFRLIGLTCQHGVTTSSCSPPSSSWLFECHWPACFCHRHTIRARLSS